MAALGYLSASARQLFRDGFMRQPRLDAIVSVAAPPSIRADAPLAIASASTHQSRPAVGVAVLLGDDELVHPPLRHRPEGAGIS
jgi:hypothetical protein